MAGQRLWCTRHACTKTVAHGNTRWQTKAHARRRVVIWLTSDLTSMCVGANQEHSPRMDEHHLGCITLPIFYHGKRSHALVTQCVRVRACKNPRRGREETRWRWFVPTDMSPCYRNSPMHTKSKDQERTRKALCVLITLLVDLTKSARICKHANETCAGAGNSDSCSWLNAATDAVAPGRAFPAS